MKIYSILLVVVLLGSCSQSGLEQELADTKKALTETQAQLSDLKAEGKLVHVVYFDLKETADISLFITEINKLRQIEVIQDLEIGRFENLGDQRALSQYELMMQMSFKDSSDYQIYQQHSVHLQLKAAAKAVIAAPPATYDFVRE